MNIDLEAMEARSAADMPALATLELFAQHNPADETLRDTIVYTGGSK
jgi:hypothetical protein